jgi:hypothetical protein
MGRGGFPPSETGSFSAHHTAQRVGFFSSGRSKRCRSEDCLASCELPPETRDPIASARLFVGLSWYLEHLI